MNSINGHSLLNYIIDGDWESASQLLGEGGINMEERDEDGQTFLMIACQLGEVEIVERLLQQQGIDVNAVDNDNWSALLNASKIGATDIVRLLLEAGADIEHRDNASWTALMWACYKGCREVVRLLLEHGANPNVKGEHHMSCLTWAAGRGHTDTVRELLHHGAKVNTADKYGTTSLIWAARRGHCEIVELLLKEDAVVDKAGMNSWTALTVAAAGGYTDVVKLLLDHHPNVNAVDKDGYTALTLAAKEGFIEIVNMLLQKEAYVNLADRYGDTVLIHAVKGNHLEVVRSLLKKYADVDAQGVENKTALYCAVEKGHVAGTRLLLDFNANIEIATKDGDTALLRAVRMRNADLVQLLVDKGAKVSVSDKHGDNALHIAIRSRSKRLTEILLRNPKHGRLLYNKNKSGETAYQIDSKHERSVLTQVFGARNLNADDYIQGYEMYSSTISDVLSEPTLRTPITVGLFARWGSGKSILLGRLKKEMQVFAQLNADPLFEFSILQCLVSITISLVFAVPFCIGFKEMTGKLWWVVGLGVFCGVLLLQYLLLGLLLVNRDKVCIVVALWWVVGLGVFCGVLLLQYLLLVIMWYGATRREWDRFISVSEYVAKKLRFLKLFFQLVFCNEPPQVNLDTAAVRFLFTDSARMTSVVGEKSVEGMISTLCDEIENQFGMLVPRLYRVFKPLKAEDHGRFRSVCCVPHFVIALFVVVCIVSACVLMAVFPDFTRGFEDEQGRIVNSVLIGLGVVVLLTLLGNIYTISRMIAALAVPLRKHVKRTARSARRHESVMKVDGLVVLLKKEVESLDHMTRCIDAFMGSFVTRMVVVVDGLESCEQDKLLQVLDMVHVLFGDSDSPFITLLTVDPHVIVRAIEHNLSRVFNESSVNGHDYLRNLVQLPFYIQSQALPKPPVRNVTRMELSAGTSGNAESNLLCQRQESSISGASMLSLTEIGKGKGSRRRTTSMAAAGHFGSTNLIKHPSQYDLSKTLGKSSYFSDINPRSMKRLMNILAVTGRLLRANNVDFNWYKLASWMNITEQWPYCLSWMILEVEDNNDTIDDTQSLRTIYDRVSSRIPTSRDIDPLVEIDRNVRKLEVFLANSAPPLTVGDMRRFLPCTINIDPYLGKLIRELQQNSENLRAEYEYRAGALPIDPLDWTHSLHSGQLPGHGSTGRLRKPSGNKPSSPRAQLAGGQKFFPPTMHLPPNLPPSTLPLPYPPGLGMYPPYHPMAAQYFYPGAFQPPAPASQQPPQPKFNVKVKGGLSSKSLVEMTVEDVVQVTSDITGIDSSRLHDYTARLRGNNITGLVLLHCSLSELKPVLAMSFGDWELFQALVETLRYRQAADTSLSSSSEAEVKGHTPMDPPPSAVSVGGVSTQSSTNFKFFLDVASPTEESRMTRRKSPVTSVSDIRAGSVHERTASTSGRAESNGSRAGSRSDRQVSNNGDAGNGGMNRANSFVTEVMMESEALRGMIAATRGGNESEDSSPSEGEGEGVRVEHGISTIPEEEVTAAVSEIVEQNSKSHPSGHHSGRKSDAGLTSMSRHSSVVSLKRGGGTTTTQGGSSRRQSFSRQGSVENATPADKVFLVGPDHDSGESDSEEVERLSRKSSIVRRTSAHSPHSGSVSRPAEHRISISDGVTIPGRSRDHPIHSTKPGAVESKTSENVPLLPSSSVLSTSLRESRRNFYESSPQPPSFLSPSSLTSLTHPEAGRGGISSPDSVASSYQDPSGLERGASWMQSKNSVGLAESALPQQLIDLSGTSPQPSVSPAVVAETRVDMEEVMKRLSETGMTTGTTGESELVTYVSLDNTDTDSKNKTSI